MKDYSKHIELAIPDNIRLGEHSDAKLVTSLIATLVVAFEEADDVWAKNRMAKVNAAIAAWDKAEFTPHIAKEDEDWNSLKAQVEQNRSEAERHKSEADSLRPKIVHISKSKKRSNGEIPFSYSGAATGTGFIYNLSAGDVEVNIVDDGAPNDENGELSDEESGSFSATAKTESEALSSVFAERGMKAEVS